MLEELRISGLGVIDEAVLPLGPGLTVVTGETGAGKTMVVTGLLLLYGGRADAGRVRSGAAQASVDGRVDASSAAVIDRVLAAGGALDGPDSTGAEVELSPPSAELVLRRVVTAAGRSRAFVGGAPAPIAVLGELAEHLVAVHGQADQQHLVRPAAQRAALDRYAGLDLAPFTVAYDAWRAAEDELAQRSGRAAELRRESDLLTHGLREIEAVDPQPGEDEQLARESSRLVHAEGLTSAATTAHDVLLGRADAAGVEPADVMTLVGSAQRGLGQHTGEDAELDALAARLADLASVAADLGAEFREYADAIDADPARLDQVESRRAALAAVVRKYCDDPDPSVEAVLRWSKDAAARLADIDVSDDALARLRSIRDAAAVRVGAQAAVLTAARTAAAAQLAAAVTAELAGLAMPDARLEVAVAPRPGGTALRTGATDLHVGPDGADDVEFLLQPHPSTAALPLGRGASGGELSRIMLALEVCLAGTDPVPTLVFDEVDAGVGGRAAVEVGRRLARLARHTQVLVVTHLAQVAAFADRHVVVDVGSAHGVRASDVRVVDDAGRVDELARMLAGSDTATAREHAAELLAAAAASSGDVTHEPGEHPARRRAGRRSVTPKKAARRG